MASSICLNFIISSSNKFYLKLWLCHDNQDHSSLSCYSYGGILCLTLEFLFEDSFYGAVPLLRHVSESLMKKKIQATLDISNKKNSVSGALPQN